MTRRTSRGQALVLGALSLLLLALMVAVSFNVSYALHEKIRLQQHSDALAYSMGIVEARAFNYFADSNRAIAASLVAMNTLHADMAVASAESDMMHAAEINFFEISGEEFAQCSWYQPQHCFHGIKAITIAFKFSKASSKYAKKAKSVDGKFEKAVTALDLMMDAIHVSQDKVLVDALKAVKDGKSSGLDQLRLKNAPNASKLPTAVGLLNDGQLVCAIDGSPLPCPKSGAPSNTSNAIHGEVIAAVANATRPDWPANRGTSLPTYFGIQFLKDFTESIQGSGFTLAIPKGTAKTIQGASQGELHAGQSSSDTGATVGADEHGTVLSQWNDGIGAFPFDAEVYSNKGGGKHSPGDTHTGRHKYEGTNTKSLTTCLMTGNCFMKFRSDPNANNDFGQPAVYSYLTMPMRADSPSKAPWQLNSSATVNFGGPDGQTGTLHLAAGDGAAVSKALVYFHQLGTWRAPPNFFDPYWRVKLHPFGTKELGMVLGAARNTDAVQLLAAPTPVY